MSPLTLSVPPLTFIGPVKVLVPVSVQVEVPILLRVPKPCTARRIDLRIRRSCRRPEPRVATYRFRHRSHCRLLVDPGASVRVLPLPANWIAKTAPVMVLN